MSRGARHRNIIAVTRAVTAAGGRVLDYTSAGKHIKMKVVTKHGNETTFTLSRSPIDPYKILGWTRQAMNKADALAATQEKKQ